MFLMDIAQSDDADRLLRELDMLKDDALEAADTAIQATDPALADLCDALRWTAANSDIQAITAVAGVWTPRGLLLTATVTVAAGPSDTKVIEHVPLSLVQGGPLLGYISKDPEALTAALVTRWSPSHAPISASRLCSQVFKGLYTAREQPPPVDTAAPPDIQSQKVSHTFHKPISQFLAPHLRPSWDRLRTREVVAAFWALPDDVHAVLQAAHIPTADLVPLKFGLLAWASSVCLTGQYTPAPVPTPPALANKGMWTPEQLRPLLECSVLPIRSVELLHQIEQAGEHSWATAPTFALLQAGIRRHRQPAPAHAAQPRTLPHQRASSAQPRRHSVRHGGVHPSVSPVQGPGQAHPFRVRTIAFITVARTDKAFFQSPRACLPGTTGCRGPHASGVTGPGRRVGPPQSHPGGGAFRPGPGCHGLLHRLRSIA